ncbi:nonstructural protein [Blackfly microvirus SF02]|uniref:Nonstructural protein n=1 Tax=Blackfly microvirus SF02 TaxID=2576452 RepID=A0A4P8PKQ2_9VIRU|nr:nonstructural protein [Blackfly microvirus SF02]
MQLYAIYDNKADDLVGGQHSIMCVKAEAVAIRAFGDIAMMQDSQIGKHIQDYDLVWLGTLENNSIIACWDIILTGERWLASQQNNRDQQNLQLGE